MARRVALSGEPGPALSRRERQVLAALIGGRTEVQASRELGLSVHTVHTYVRRIMEKLGVHKRASLVRRGLGLGFGVGPPLNSV